MEFKSRIFLLPGPSKETPITFVVENLERSEDGERARVEFDLTLEAAEAMANDLRTAVGWVRSGAWMTR